MEEKTLKTRVQEECAHLVFSHMYTGKYPYKIRKGGENGVTPEQVRGYKIQACKVLESVLK